MKGRPRSSAASRARKGSTAATPGIARRKGTISGGRSPTSPRRPPAAALTQRSERSVVSTQTRTVSRIEETVTIIASVMPSAIASAATAIAFRARDPPKNSTARRPAAPKTRASGPAAARQANRTRIGAAAASARDHEHDGRESEERETVDVARERGGRRENDQDGRARAPSRETPPIRTTSIEPGRIAGEGSTRVASAAGRSVARSDGGHSDGRGETGRREIAGRGDLRGRKVDVRHGAGDARESRPREKDPAGFPEERSRQSHSETLRDEDGEDRGPGGADRAQRGDLGAAPQDRDRDGVGDQEHADQERERGERVQVEAEGAHHPVGGLGRPPRRLRA